MDDERTTRRKTRQREEARQLLIKPWLLEKVPPIGGLIQCGLGDWAEGPVLLEKFGSLPWLAVEPVHRYCFEAYREGFRGHIVQGALWDTTGKYLALSDFRTRTSVHDTEKRHLGKFETVTYTLDDVCEFTQYSAENILLWMDAEGAEPNILRGAQHTLKNVLWIVCELKDEPKFAGWLPTMDMTRLLVDAGFRFVKRVADDGLFVRREWFNDGREQ